jgi:hypothetical protein
MQTRQSGESNVVDIPEKNAGQILNAQWEMYVARTNIEPLCVFPTKYRPVYVRFVCGCACVCVCVCVCMCVWVL